MCWSTVLARVMDTGDGRWNERMGSIDGVAARVGAAASARDQRVPVWMHIDATGPTAPLFSVCKSVDR